jgi:hypothetical protein
LAHLKGETRDKVAKVARLSHSTLAKINFIADHAPEAVKEKLRRGGIEKVVQTFAQPKTRDAVAKAAKVSHHTIDKIKLIAAG